MNWLLDPSFSTYGPDIDRLYYIILFITGAVFVLTQGALVYFLIRFRNRDGQKAAYEHGSVRAEVIWTAVPFVIVIALGLMSRATWNQIKDPSSFPDDAYEVLVTARQFEWVATYPGADGVLGTGDDFSVLNRLEIPANRPVIVHLEADDVIHSFFVPRFRVKQDAVPGMSIPIWFEVTEPGEYELACAELCGIGHYRMGGMVVAHAPEDFDAWLEERIAARAGIDAGRLATEEASPDPDGPASARAPAQDAHHPAEGGDS
jgi:cytochrome c oxidase subunit II